MEALSGTLQTKEIVTAYVKKKKKKEKLWK